jgi:nitrogen-specific signal transduction histidine kinase
MSTMTKEIEELELQIKNFKAGIREISHDINNPLGVMRMAAYFLQSSKLDDEKRTQYFQTINDSINKIEANLKRLKSLRENPLNGLDTPPPNGSE